ncbi:CusA/CzcA family heavy metal efflux RND transporter [uncultured Hyphomicrobium sp.]|uniref:efflux RND transporter permease subunit n=1 Tax=uncultured Hyphomicrobium sp. TaxID=194373 RepID=UPI0025F4C5C6|nr:CusA/CzcA family heavy metal efflux RND transporter [uncultured Hyphomicrobium sp.]
MISRLIRWSATNLVLIIIAAMFVVGAGIYAVRHVPLDAIPDLSDTQVIIYTEYSGQAPQVIEDQVTFPLSTAMLSVPKSRVVRGFSFFGVSFVYVIFQDGTDIYWARSRVLEYLSAAARNLPAGVTPTLGPDATGVGWVYQYAVIAAKRTLAELRSTQDWQVRYAVAKAEGVAEVASVGGFVRQYSVVVDPRRLKAFDIPLATVRDAIRQSNMDVGGRVVELAETEFMVRGRGYLRGVQDLEAIALKAVNGTPVLLRDVASIELTPDERRGVTELNGEGEVVSGIAVQRYGQNALSVIENVKSKLTEIRDSLPAGTEIFPVYDRSELIGRAIATLKSTLIEESLIVALVCMVFLLHARSALVAIITLPLGILIAYICMHALGLSSNIMSLGGIAIAIGAMVDAAIVMIENAHKHLERAPPGKPRTEVLIEAASEVGPALFFSLLIITVSFLPIFALEAQEGRLFHPLAFTKTFAMAAAALLSVTVVPALMVLFVRGRIVPEHRNPVNRTLIWIYRPIIGAVLKAKRLTIVLALAVLSMSVWPATKLGSEFMPNLNEGTLLYMPTTLPGLSITKAAELLQTQNRIIRSFPEVASVWGKAGRAATATDPAPTEMFETVINLKPEAEWRAGMTLGALIDEMDKALQFPGVSNAWTMPIKARIDMLATGIRTPVGVKVIGPDLHVIDGLAREIERAIKSVPGTASAFAERIIGGYYLEIEPDRRQLARYGLLVGDVQQVIASAMGAETVTTTVEGRERYAVSLRYPRDMRSDPDAMAREVLVPLASGASVPLGEIATIKRTRGPASIRTENAQLAAYIFVDARDRDLGSYVADARRAVANTVKFPTGYYAVWSGQFEYYERAKQRLAVVVPLTLLVILLLLYLNFRRMTETLIVMLSLPFALVGGLWLMWWMGFNLSVAAAVGFIALAGVAAETGVIMLIYLDHALADRRKLAERERRQFTANDLHAAIMEGAVERVRPKMMTVVAIMAGLLPILWSHGTGSEVMQRIAVPMVGGMVSSAILTLVVIPAVYAIVKGRSK